MRGASVAPLALALILAACAGDEGDRPVRGETPPDRACDTYTSVGRMRVPEVVARGRAGEDAPRIARFSQVNPQGAQQVFPILDDGYRDGRVWHEVLLPIRPNGTTGWIPANAVSLRRTDYRIEIDLERLELRLFDRCERLDRFPIGVGTRDTPTPHGTFFLNSLLRPPQSGSVYGALAFGLSGYSEVIKDWAGGGIVGIHGTNDPSSIGHRVSHGCIRLRNAAIRELARTVPLGTPVTIA